jgi:hypothetical protein
MGQSKWILFVASAVFLTATPRLHASSTGIATTNMTTAGCNDEWRADHVCKRPPRRRARSDLVDYDIYRLASGRIQRCRLAQFGDRHTRTDHRYGREGPARHKRIHGARTHGPEGEHERRRELCDASRSERERRLWNDHV